MVPDAFQNPEYLRRFAFAGCLAASSCYVIYNALDWPGIFPSVLTCVVTALTTIGEFAPGTVSPRRLLPDLLPVGWCWGSARRF